MSNKYQLIRRKWDKRPDGNYIGSIFESLEKRINSGKITIREAAIELYIAGWTNFIDEDKTKQLLNITYKK